MVTINIGRKVMIFFSVVILVFAVVGFSVAFGGNQPAVVGHTAGEIERCADGETLVMSGGEWTCGVGSGGGASYDSGWFSVAKQTDYTRTHNLGNRPDIVEVWFSPDSAGSSAVLISDGWTDAAGVHGIQIREVTSSDIKITTSHQYLATSVNNPRITYHSGYVKIIAKSLSGGGSGSESNCVKLETPVGATGHYEINLIKNGVNICEVPYGCETFTYKRRDSTGVLTDMDGEANNRYIQDENGNYREDLGGESGGVNGDGSDTKIRDWLSCDTFDDKTDEGFTASKDTLIIRDNDADEYCVINICRIGS